MKKKKSNIKMTCMPKKEKEEEDQKDDMLA